MDYTTLSDEAITAGLKACAEMAANPSSKELFEWALAQHGSLKAEEARRVSARSPAALALKAQEQVKYEAEQERLKNRGREYNTDQVHCLYRVPMTLTEREQDLLHALQHVLKADLGKDPQHNRDWARYHLTRATQGMGGHQPEIVHELLDRWAGTALETEEARRALSRLAPRVSADQLLRAFKAHGIETSNVRDGAHEAAHALEWDVWPPWTRKKISGAAPSNTAMKFRAELLARAVEQIVCEATGAPCDDLPKRAMTAAMEALKMDRYSAPLDAWIKGIENALKSEAAKALAVRVLTLPEDPLRVRTPPEIP